MKSMTDLLDSVGKEVLFWRRLIHKYPELSFQEKDTADLVYDTLRSFGNVEVSRPTETSVIGRLRGGRPGRKIALRADMDALPIQEENDFEYVSAHSGVMHACGHDGHTAILIGVAKILSQVSRDMPGEIIFIFQHAEELYPGGAKELVDLGVLEDAECIFGIHLWTPLSVGKIGIIYGPAMAAPDKFWITIKGQGGHLSVAHNTVDCITIGSEIVTSLHHVVARNINALDHAVLYITKFSSGVAHNIVPNVAELQGAVRTFDANLRKKIPNFIESKVKGITLAYGADYEFKYEFGYSPVINDIQLTEFVEFQSIQQFGEENIERMRPLMAGEDFSAYQQVVPGSLILIGAGNRAKGISYPHHHPQFAIDEESLTVGLDLLVNLCLSSDKLVLSQPIS